MLEKFVIGTLISLTLAGFSAKAAFCHGEVFSDYSYGQAKEQARTNEKILLIDFTASWCPPCRMMEKNTWTDPGLKDWIKKNALAIQVDVDKDKKTTALLKVRAMPTMVVFAPNSGDKEFGRKVGYMSPAELLRWLESVKSGKSKEVSDATDVTDATTASGADQAKPGNSDRQDASEIDPGLIITHFSKARESMAAGNNAEALEEHLWIWKNARSSDPTIANLRISSLPIEMKKLAAIYPAAKESFVKLRDEADKADDRTDWIVLNSVLGEDASTLSWFDTAKEDPLKKSQIEKNASALVQPLALASRWKDIALVIFDKPIDRVNDYHKKALEMLSPDPNTQIATDFDPFPYMVQMLYLSYLGAGLHEEARSIREECLRLDDKPAMREMLDKLDSSMKQAAKSSK